MSDLDDVSEFSRPGHVDAAIRRLQGLMRRGRKVSLINLLAAQGYDDIKDFVTEMGEGVFKPWEIEALTLLHPLVFIASFPSDELDASAIANTPTEYEYFTCCVDTDTGEVTSVFLKDRRLLQFLGSNY